MEGVRSKESVGRFGALKAALVIFSAWPSANFWSGIMNGDTSQLLYFYNRHPISRDIILAKLQASRGHLNNLRPEELFPHDQDHYGGLRATDELARQAGIGSGTLVADFCAGLGGTVRYLAYKYGANVTGIEFTPVRVAGAQDLTRRVGLQDMARIVEGNVMDVPLADASVDAVVSQESFCHVPDVKKAVMEARRILDRKSTRLNSSHDQI